MYVELTPQDTIRDLRNILISAIPGFEFPRCDLYSYKLESEVKGEDETLTSDFIIGMLWNETPDGQEDQPPKVVVEHSSFDVELTSEEINILAILMMCGWVQRQVTSIENTRMKYTGSNLALLIRNNYQNLSKKLEP